MDIYGVDTDNGVSLGYHQGDNATTGAHVEHAVCSIALGACPNKHAVGGDGHGTEVVAHFELFKSEQALFHRGEMRR